MLDTTEDKWNGVEKERCHKDNPREEEDRCFKGEQCLLLPPRGSKEIRRSFVIRVGCL